MRSQYLAKQKGEDLATADRREFKKANKRAYDRRWRAANRETYKEIQKRSLRKLAARKKFQQKRDELTDTTVKSLECATQNQATAPTTRALTHAVRSQYVPAKHNGEDRATSVSSNMQTLMVQADKECLDWVRATIVEEIEKRIPCEASSHRATADRREYRKAKKRVYDRRWKASNIEKCKEAWRKWYAANKEEVLKTGRKWRAANIKRCKGYQRRFNARRRLTVLYKRGVRFMIGLPAKFDLAAPEADSEVESDEDLNCT